MNVGLIEAVSAEGINWKLIPIEIANAISEKGELVFLGLRGSLAHGVVTPDTDDIDLVGAYIAPPSYYLGVPPSHDGTITIAREIGGVIWDVVLYELRKFIGLLLKGNPNVLQTLFLPASMVALWKRPWDVVVRNKELFLSKQTYYSFAGYAWHQLQLMDRGDNRRTASEIRKALTEKHGYDVKAASHLIRLLEEAIIFLKEGALPVPLPPGLAAEILEIKTGQWDRKRVIGRAEELFEAASKAKEESHLPDKPDADRISELATNLLARHICKYYEEAYLWVAA